MAPQFNTNPFDWENQNETNNSLFFESGGYEEHDFVANIKVIRHKYLINIYYLPQCLYFHNNTWSAV